MGPHSRDRRAQASPDDLTDAAFPFSTAREIEVGAALARAHRLSYVGELGWELYVPADMARHVFDRLMEAGEPLDLKLCGLHALDSLRSEKAYRHFGHDIGDEDHVLAAGLRFAVQTAKPDSRCGPFIAPDPALSMHAEALPPPPPHLTITTPPP